MTEPIEADEEGAILTGQLVWPKSWDGQRNDEQQRSLRRMVRDSRDGMVLDCSLVEVGTSEVINVLMRVRNHAMTLNKHLVLFNVPEHLCELIQLCHLGSILLIESDADAATKSISDRARGQQSGQKR
jgi:anti-anti-sigma regulatory factor